MKCKHVKREGESCMLNNNCNFPNCESDLNMRTVKVNNCLFCPFIEKGADGFYCGDSGFIISDIRNGIDINCELKNRSVKIELKELEMKQPS